MRRGFAARLSQRALDGLLFEMYGSVSPEKCTEKLMRPLGEPSHEYLGRVILPVPELLFYASARYCGCWWAAARSAAADIIFVAPDPWVVQAPIAEARHRKLLAAPIACERPIRLASPDEAPQLTWSKLRTKLVS